MTDTVPFVKSRRVRATLAEMRGRIGHSIDSVTRALQWPDGRLREIETGLAAVSDEELQRLLDHYGVSDSDTREEIREAARVSRKQSWWSQYRGKIPDHYVELISAEADASRIIHFQPTFVPGLLQTESYAATVTPLTTLDYSPDEYTQTRVDVRMRRQHEVLNANRTEFVALVDETVLHRRVGPPAVMREQFDLLAETIKTERGTVVIVPTSFGPHPGLLGAFMSIEYDDPALDTVLCMSGALGNVIIRNEPGLAEKYNRLAEQLIHEGLKGAAALAAIENARTVFE